MTNHWSGNHFAFALFKKDNGDTLTDVITRDVLKDTSPTVIQLKVHRRFLRLGIKARLSIVQVVARQNHATLHKKCVAFAVLEAFVTKGNVPRSQLRKRFRTIVHQAHFKRSGTTQDVFSLSSILHTWQLNHDTVSTLLTNHRFRNAQFVNTIVQRGDVLL